MELIPIYNTPEKNTQFLSNPDCKENLGRMLDFYKQVGFKPPWIGYFARRKNNFIGSCGFKGGPKDGKVELAYITFEAYRQQGVANEMCRQLVQMALDTDPSIKITALTLPELNYSTRILRKNGFIHTGSILDPEDGEVWEWEYRKG